jgi:hypothetical protein
VAWRVGQVDHHLAEGTPQLLLGIADAGQIRESITGSVMSGTSSDQPPDSKDFS